MASHEDLNKSYRRMTDATEATRRAVDRVDDSVRANTRATQLGNVIAGVAALRAEVNAKKTRARIDAVGGKIDDMSAAVTEKLDQLDNGVQSLTGEVAKTNEQLEHLKDINFAQWRDGVGQTYWYEYRPLGRKLLEDYDELSLAWRHLVAHRVTEVIDRYPEWKDKEWLPDSIRDGQYYPYPKFPSGPKEVGWAPGNVSYVPRKSYTSFGNVLISFIIFFAVMMGVTLFYGIGGTIFEELREESTIGSYKDDENKAIYPMLKYWPENSNCREQSLPDAVKRLRDRSPVESEMQKAWSGAVEATPEQLREACEKRIEIKGEDYNRGDPTDPKNSSESMQLAPKLGFAMGLACVALFMLRIRSKNRKIDAHNRQVDEVIANHRGAVSAAQKSWENECSRISTEWAAKNRAAGKEMERRFTELVGVPLSGKGASEFWAAPSTKREAHAWTYLLKNDRTSPPSRDDYFEPSRIQVNPRMPGWYRQRFESSYRAVVPHEL